MIFEERVMILLGPWFASRKPCGQTADRIFRECGLPIVVAFTLLLPAAVRAESPHFEPLKTECGRPLSLERRL